MMNMSEKLPDDPEELKAIIHGKDEHITILEEQIRVLKKEIFGRKSEKRPVQEEGLASATPFV